MGEETKSPDAKASKVRRCFRRWRILVAVIFFGLFIYTQFLPGGRRSFADWIPPLLFLLVVSAVFATVLLCAWLLACWLCRWRNLKRLFFLGVSIVILIVLFYAVEDWRGWHAWNRFKGEWEAKGERFDLASVVPPLVPAEQNFAMTPIAFTSYGQVLTRDGKLIPEEKRDANFDARMRMAIAHDFPGYTDYLGNRTKKTFSKLERWQSYYRKRTAETNEYPVAAQAQSPAADVLLALSKYDGVIGELREASQLPASRFPVNYEGESPLEMSLPHLAVLRTCTQALQLRSLAELQNGQTDKALEETRLALQLAEKVRTEPLIISHIVRMVMMQAALQPIWEGLAQHKWSEAQLVALDEELAKLDFVADYRLSMKGEAAVLGEGMDYFRRHPEKLGELKNAGFDGKQNDLYVPQGFAVKLIPAGWFYQNQYRSVRMILDHYMPVADVNAGTFSPAMARRADEVLAAETKSVTPYNQYERLMTPLHGNAVRRFANGQASVNLARTAIALERYRLGRGEFPESLEALAPQFIAKVPHDVIGGQPLKYRREADGGFVLYSIGWNETDDGGVAAFKDGSEDLQSGDWVWQYPAKGAER